MATHEEIKAAATWLYDNYTHDFFFKDECIIAARQMLEAAEKVRSKVVLSVECSECGADTIIRVEDYE